MKLRKHFKKRVKKVKKLLPDVVTEKAASFSPLPRPPEPISLKDVPHITSETITEHREEVLSGARKYIYPLAHSKHRILVISSGIAAVTIITFLVYCGLALYKFYQYNTFLYRVTQVIPFPIARAGDAYVNYENYLFELRHYIHYYQTQQQRLFGGQQQINQFRKQALQNVINNGYVKTLAKKNGVKVSDREVDARINEVRQQNRLGSNNKVFADVLRDYWGWSIADFRRSLKDQMLAERVVAKLDVGAQAKAQSVLAQSNAGADFGSLAAQNSDDPSKASNGDWGFGITKTNPNVSPEVINELFKLKAGQVSGIILASRVDINKPDTLEIVKVIGSDGTTVTAQHISFNLKDISFYIKDLQAKEPSKTYVRF
ncbi:SurA N-terminal domain-containing protein [Candidatus Saccharibacteria bacterium]|nr:SurA N-terminal domain-containing protein [Candidatus Saccharibacteria bacterium]